MPRCFQLTRKSDLAAGPVNLNLVDEEMCARFLTSVHPTKYYMGWFDCIGWRIATGMSFDDIRAEAAKEPDGYLAQMIPIVEWLDENFTTNAFYQPKW